MKSEVFKKFLSGILVVSIALVLGACQSAASSNSGAASQKAGGQQAAKTVEKAPEVVERPPVVDTTPVQQTPVASGENGIVKDEYGNIMGRMVNGVFVPDPGYVPGGAALLSQTVIYFDFDQSTIRPEFRDVLAAHAANLATKPGMSLRLEGHADERGSREYNIGLGERRAQAVKRALMLNGVKAGNLNTISYGEEKPMVQGTGEQSWSKNRRVELVYR